MVLGAGRRRDARAAPISAARGCSSTRAGPMAWPRRSPPRSRPCRTTARLPSWCSETARGSSRRPCGGSPSRIARRRRAARRRPLRERPRAPGGDPPLALVAAADSRGGRRARARDRARRRRLHRSRRPRRCGYPGRACDDYLIGESRTSAQKFPFRHTHAPSRARSTATVAPCRSPSCRPRADAALRDVFGLAGYRPGQRQVVEALLAGRSALAVFPTGGGKSLCYQLPAVVLEGTCLVVSPLVALMKDQIDALTARGVAAARLDSSLTFDETQAVQDRLARRRAEAALRRARALRQRALPAAARAGASCRSSRSTRRTASRPGGTRSGPTT